MERDRKGLGPGVATPGKPSQESPLQPSEQPLMGDGQLGGEAIERQGAEEKNPEGSVDISDEDLRE